MEINEEVRKAVDRTVRDGNEKDLLTGLPNLESDALSILLAAGQLDDKEVEGLCRSEITDEEIGMEEFEKLNSDTDAVLMRRKSEEANQESTKS